jgi:hypothetical protein
MGLSVFGVCVLFVALSSVCLLLWLWVGRGEVVLFQKEFSSLFN